MFILAELLSSDNQPHSSKVLVPSGTKVKKAKPCTRKKNKVKIRPKLNDLIIKDVNGFDEKTRTILCPITEKEYKQRKKR